MENNYPVKQIKVFNLYKEYKSDQLIFGDQRTGRIGFVPEISSKIIECILLDQPMVPFLFQKCNNQMRITDGAFRLSVIFGFIDGLLYNRIFTFYTNNKALKKCNHLTFEEMPAKIKAKIKSYRLTVCIVPKEDDEIIKLRQKVL